MRKKQRQEQRGGGGDYFRALAFLSRLPCQLKNRSFVCETIVAHLPLGWAMSMVRTL